MSLKLDTVHSSIEFAVRHMGLATVRGHFEKFDVQVEAGPDGVPTSVKAEIDAASITTGTEARDNHLRSPDFLDAASYPTIRFESSSIRKGGDGYVVEGDLTIRDVTKPVSFTAEFTGFMKDPWGNARAAAEANGKLNRTQFGLVWNQILDAGALLVGEEVRFAIAVQMVQPAEVTA